MSRLGLRQACHLIQRHLNKEMRRRIVLIRRYRSNTFEDLRRRPITVSGHGVV
jgi:hypothetical protein